MISLILSVFCSTSIALILKRNDTKKGHPLVLLAGNYLIASLICLFFLLFSHDPGFSWQTLLLGMLLGFLFVFTFFVFAKSVGRAGTAFATVSSRLSVFIPTLLSIIIYNEVPGKKQYAGFFFTLLTILLFYFSLRTSSVKKHTVSDYLYLLLLLLGIGINDFGMKIFQQGRPAAEKSLFLLSIFGSAFIYSSGFLILKGILFEKRTLFRGAILGVPNIFSSFFLIGALSSLPAVIVFPSVNISVIVLTSISAYIIWKERLNWIGILSIICGLTAIVLLGLK